MINLDKITSIYGPSASGKTTLAIQSMINLLKENKKILYLDTEGKFSLERIKQISDINLDNLLVLKIKNFKEQQMKINELENIKNISLIVIDTINNHYRTLVKSKSELANRMLIKQLRILKRLNIPVIVVSQVYTNPTSGEIVPTGNNIIKIDSNQLIELKKDPRKIIYKNENKEHFFKITNKGIEII